VIILGISGLANSVRFKKETWRGLDEREYRISQGHDSAAALVVNGVTVAAAAQERFNRKKHCGDFPAEAISFCLRQAGIAMEELDEIAHAYDYSPLKEIYSLDPLSEQLYQKVLSPEVLLAQVSRYCPEARTERVHPVGHHLCHAASAYFTSGWDEALVMVLDAMGEAQGASIFHGHNGSLHKLREMPANDSIGILYSLVTLHLGFDFNSDEYKIMGLAPYGDPRRYRDVFCAMVEGRSDGGIRIPFLRLNRTREERENYGRSRAWLAENLIAPRAPEDLITQDHCDVAAGLQACLERAVLHICSHFRAATGLGRLAMAGGVALNCSANGKLMRSGLFDEIYVQPAAGDDGAALGAALYRASLQGVANRRFPAPFLGPSYAAREIESALDQFANRICVTRFDSFEDCCRQAAEMVAQGQVLAWCRGRMEFGPRALGNRSIVADPGHPEMRDRINLMVKKREAFRPFAPAVTIEEVHRWFDVPPLTSLPYMIATFDVRPAHRATLPAITHVNGSARVQTVSAADNPEFSRLLHAVGRTTGREMLLNTSFNVKGQPIVNTPCEALATFLSTGIDGLFLENVLVTRREGIVENRVRPE
jgi:carbamoyltransferase